ncbi:hypothetical protein [Hymenobacter terrenus]|uniref:hypothetical protein n=1 Tax=Hymenobacter terrenus TaxID=1629124 RepID=UPI000A4DD387|nr:hypothetical protein [Hymenobacter terrenus]
MNSLEKSPLVAQTVSTANADCRLEVTITYPTATALHIRYRVHNASQLPLYLFNQLYKRLYRRPETNTLVYDIDSNLVNVHLSAERVTVGKAVVDVPDWILVEALQTPCLSRVLPGESIEEVMELSLPLMPYTVYDYSPSQGPLVARTLFIELGYILASPYTESFITPVTTNSTVETAYHIGALPADEQSLITAGPFEGFVSVVSSLS